MKSSCVVKNCQPASWLDLDFHKIELTRLFMRPKKPNPYLYIYFLSLIRLMSSSPILPWSNFDMLWWKNPGTTKIIFSISKAYWRLLISYLRMLAYFNHSHPIPPCRFFLMRPLLRSHICVHVCRNALISKDNWFGESFLYMAFANSSSCCPMFVADMRQTLLKKLLERYLINWFLHT